MSVLDQLKTLSSAEDFFTTLNVAYEPQILHVARLHILKRMGQYLASTAFEGMADAEVRAAARDTLERAYGDFAASSPLAERVFKVLKERDPHAPPAPKGAFVPLTALFDSVQRT